MQTYRRRILKRQRNTGRVKDRDQRWVRENCGLHVMMVKDIAVLIKENIEKH